MIRKIYQYAFVLLGLCLGMTACSDDNDELDSAAAIPSVQFPIETLNIDLNKVDNLPVVAVIKSAVGLKEVNMKIKKEKGIENYKTVTEFFNEKSYSLSENLNYDATYKAFIIDAVDKLNRMTSDTLEFSITDIMAQPEIAFELQEIVYDEMEENPVMPRTTFTVTAEAGLKSVEMYLVTSEGQNMYGQAVTNFENPNEYVFDELIQYKENSRSFKVKVEDLYGNVKISSLKVSYRTAPAPVLNVDATEIFAEKDETKAIDMNITSVRGLRAIKVFRTEDGKETEVVNQPMNGEHEWNGNINVLFTNATSSIRIVADDGKKQTEASVIAYVNMVYQQVQIASQFAANAPNAKYPDIYSCFSFKDMQTYSVDYALGSKENAANVDFKFYCHGANGIPRFYSMDQGEKNSDFKGSKGNLGALAVKNQTRFVKLNASFDFDKATAATIEKAITDGTIVTSTMVAKIDPIEVGDVIAFKTGGSSAAGKNRYGLIKVSALTPPKEIINVNPTARVITLTIKFPKK